MFVRISSDNPDPDSVPKLLGEILCRGLLSVFTKGVDTELSQSSKVELVPIVEIFSSGKGEEGTISVG